MAGLIIIIPLSFLLGALVIKVGIDNSKSTQYSKEILHELREIKELLKKQRAAD